MPHSRFRHVVAILVLFDPGSDPRAVVAQLAARVGAVVLVDNALHGHPLSASFAPMPQVQLLHNANRGGLAGAYNAAISHLEASDLEWTHVVFVDDDSDPSVLAALLSDEATRGVLERADTGAVSAAYRDRATGLRASYTQLGRFGFRYLPREQQGLSRVAFLINSMSVWRRAALRAIGPFNESLEVDRVDTDYCLRARAAGLSTFVNGSYVFAHSIGARVRYQLLGMTLQSGGHGPRRRFMIARNTTWLARRYALSSPALLLLSVLWLGYEIIGILAAEGAKAAKLAALAKGIGHGLFFPFPAAAAKA